MKSTSYNASRRSALKTAAAGVAALALTGAHRQDRLRRALDVDRFRAVGGPVQRGHELVFGFERDAAHLRERVERRFSMHSQLHSHDQRRHIRF